MPEYPRNYPEDGDKPLLVPAPYDGLYDLYLMSKSDFYLRELDNYNNSALAYAPPKEKEETFGADDLGSGAYQAYSDQRANDYRSMADGLAGSPIFRGMDDETRDKVLKAAYDLADKSALEDHSDGQYKITTKWMTLADEAEAVGVEPWEYVLFHVAYNEAETTRDENGDAMKGETKSDHVREWLELSGLTQEQQEFLWGTVYKSEW